MRHQEQDFAESIGKYLGRAIRERGRVVVVEHSERLISAAAVVAYPDIPPMQIEFVNTLKKAMVL